MNYSDNHGQRWTGWILPDTTAPYRFLLTSDDALELWLSPDANPANKGKIASYLNWTNPRQWSSASNSS